MKYSEYLQLVKAQLADPQGTPGPDGKRKTGAICYANGDVLVELRIAAQQAQDVEAAQRADAHYDRLDGAIARVMLDLRLKLEPHMHSCMYPRLLREVERLGGEQPDYSDSWAQKVRHELLDKFIAEAQQEEAAAKGDAR